MALRVKMELADSPAFALQMLAMKEYSAMVIIPFFFCIIIIVLKNAIESESFSSTIQRAYLSFVLPFVWITTLLLLEA